MQRFLSIALGAVATTITIAGCSGGGTSPGSGGGGGAMTTAPPVITESYAFPASMASASAGTAWAITGISTRLSGQYGTGKYDTLAVSVSFAQNIINALPSPGAMLSTDGSELGVQIYIDSDGNLSTGGQGACNPASGVTPFEYLTIGAGRLPDGNYSIAYPGGEPTYEGASDPAAEAVTSVSMRALTESFYLPSIDVTQSTLPPKIGIAAAAFNGTTVNFDDCVPAGPLNEVLTNVNKED